MIWIILLVTIILRLIGINQSMWLDEAISANVVKLPVGQIVNNFSVGDFHPPFYYWFLSFWVKIFGNTVIAMRLSSILFSVITIFGIYKIGEKLGKPAGRQAGKKVALWAAWFTAINPLLIYYGQELRMYMMTTMWLVWAVYYWIKIINSSTKLKVNWKNWILFNSFCLLAFVTFYASAFLIGAMMLYFLFKKEWQNFVKSSLGIVLAVIVISPLLLGQLKMSNEALNEVVNWGLVLGKVNLKNLLLVPLKFSIGRVSWYPKNFYYLTAGLWTVFVWLIALKNSKKEAKLVWLMIIPLVLGIIFSFKSPMIQYFRFLYLVPILALVLAKEKIKLIKILLSVGFLGFSLFYVLNPTMHREDWKSLVNQLVSSSVSQIYMVKSFEDPIKFYNPDIKILDIREKISEKNVWVVPYGEIIHGVNHKEILKEEGFKLERQINFRENILEEWQKI
jgi:uncharacterized membrane protein